MREVINIVFIKYYLWMKYACLFGMKLANAFNKNTMQRRKPMMLFNLIKMHFKKDLLHLPYRKRIKTK